MSFIHSPIFIIFLLFFSILFIIFLISFFECSSYIFTFYNIVSNKINNKFRIIYFSDFHDKFYNNEDKLISSIVNLNPNIIIIGGDLIDFSSIFGIPKEPKLNNSIRFIEKLVKNFNSINNNINYNQNRIFFALGNHESRLKDKYLNKYNDLIEHLKFLSIIALDGESIDIENNVSLFGFNLYKGYYGKFKSNKHLKINDINQNLMIHNNKYNIALFHKPDYIEDLIGFGFDLVISGHNHGGLIKLPYGRALISPDFKFFPKFNYGLYKIFDKNAIVTNGLGEHLFKIRVNNKPEIVVIDIN